MAFLPIWNNMMDKANKDERFKGVFVRNFEKIQGGEYDLVILSPCIRGNCNDYQSDFRRCSVPVTRGKGCVCMILPEEVKG